MSFLQLDQTSTPTLVIPYYPALGERIGVSPALVLVQLNYWLRADYGIQHGDDTMLDFSYRQMIDLAFRGWKASTLGNIIRKLTADGLLTVIKDGQRQLITLTNQAVELLKLTVQKLHSAVQKMDSPVQILHETVQNLHSTLYIEDIKDIKESKDSLPAEGGQGDATPQPPSLSSEPKPAPEPTPPTIEQQAAAPPAPVKPPRSDKQRIITAIAQGLADNVDSDNPAYFYGQAGGLWQRELEPTHTNFNPIDPDNFEAFCREWSMTGLNFPTMRGKLMKHYLYYRDYGKLLTEPARPRSFAPPRQPAPSPASLIPPRQTPLPPAPVVIFTKIEKDEGGSDGGDK